MCFQLIFIILLSLQSSSEIFLIVLIIYHLLFQHQDGKIRTQASMLNMIKDQMYSGIVDRCMLLFSINISYI